MKNNRIWKNRFIRLTDTLAQMNNAWTRGPTRSSSQQFKEPVKSNTRPLVTLKPLIKYTLKVPFPLGSVYNISIEKLTVNSKGIIRHQVLANDNCLFIDLMVKMETQEITIHVCYVKCSLEIGFPEFRVI